MDAFEINKIKIIGVTGNIGAGKTTVSEILKSLGGYLISADKISHEIIKPNQRAYADLIKAFGLKILQDDRILIDHKKLASMAFVSQDNLNMLNDITHEIIVTRIISLIKKFYYKQEEHDFIILDAGLLIETQLNLICDQVWLIYCDPKIKRARAKNPDTIDQREHYQIDFESAKKFASLIIYNDKSLEDLEQKIKQLVDEFINTETGT